MATLVFSLLSCRNDDTFGDDYEDYTSLICWSEPDMVAQPLRTDFVPTTPMIFRMGEKYSFCYRLFKPKGYEESDQQLPLIIYLHGLDQRGSDNIGQMNYSVNYFMTHADYPAFVTFPQCPKDAYWGLKNRPKSFSPNKMELSPKHSYMDYGICQLIIDLEKNYPIDPQRIYIAGHSMGGIGTLDFIASHPGVFAAALAFCGTINPDRFTTNREVPLMMLHNADDDIVTVEGSRQTYRRLLHLGSEVVYKEGASGGHICWQEATQTPDMLAWLMSHSLNTRFGDNNNDNIQNRY
ncbi:MAG: alpha/beta hydrolase-fold protein [Muribaculaceae bacterium]